MKTLIMSPLACIAMHLLAGMQLAFFWLLAVLVPLPAAAFEITEVRSPGGISAWLVEDYTIPIISVSMEFAGGSNHDPLGREGLTALLSAMMDEGAGDLDAASLKAELEDQVIKTSFSVSRDSLSANLTTLVAGRERAFELMALMLQQPAFEESQLERVRAAFLASLERRQKSPGAMASAALREQMYPDHPYGRDDDGSAQSLSVITRQDITEQYRRLLVRDRLHVGVVGAISPLELASRLDQLFAGLPAGGELPVIEDADPLTGFREEIAFDGPQTEIRVVWPGVKRGDPDFFAAHLVNHIFGGGSFSSRLYQEIREKRGLAYSIGSSLATLEHSAYISAGMSTRPDQSQMALELLLGEARRMAETGPSAEELEAAREYVLGAYAINNFGSTAQIADVLVGLQTEGLGRDYVETRKLDIGAVTLDEVRAVARRLFGASPGVVTVGPAAP